jgi:hypothetical protein
MDKLAGLGSMPPPSNGFDQPVQTLVWGIVYCSVIILVTGLQIFQARKANRFKGKVRFFLISIVLMSALQIVFLIVDWPIRSFAIITRWWFYI